MHKLYGPIGRVNNKDVFLTMHARMNLRKYRIKQSNVLNALSSPNEVFIDRTSKPRIKGFKRKCYVKRYNKRYLIIVTEEDNMVIIVTSFNIHDEKKYQRHRQNKISKGEWVPID